MTYKVTIASSINRRKKSVLVDSPSSREAQEQVEQTLDEKHFVFDVARCDFSSNLSALAHF